MNLKHVSRSPPSKRIKFDSYCGTLFYSSTGSRIWKLALVLPSWRIQCDSFCGTLYFTFEFGRFCAWFSLFLLCFILLFKFGTEKQDDSKTHQNRFTNPSKPIHKPIKTYSRFNQNHPALMQQRSNNDSGPNQYPTHVNRTDCFNWKYDPAQMHQRSNNDPVQNQHP